MTQECLHCGKKGIEFDLAWEGKQCRRPVIIDPAVGGWLCGYKPLPVVDGVTQDVGDLHDPTTFVGGKKHCAGCGHTIRSE